MCLPVLIVAVNRSMSATVFMKDQTASAVIRSLCPLQNRVRLKNWLSLPTIRQNELVTRILDYIHEDSVTEKTLGCAVADAGYAALMDVGHNSGIAASNMFAAIVNMNLDDMIDTMHPVPYTNEDCKY